MRYLDLNEGPNDPNIFKAIIFAGGPGSGKGYVGDALALASKGLKKINSDEFLEYLMIKNKLDLTMPPEEDDARNIIRNRAKHLTSAKQNLAIDGRLGLSIDGTAKDVDKTAKVKASLEQLGYEVMMVFVDTSLRTSLERNNMRLRRVPVEIVVASHKEVQANKLKLRNLFGANFIEVNNEGVSNFAPAEKALRAFLNKPLSPVAKDWVSKQRVRTESDQAIAHKINAFEDVSVDQLSKIEQYADVLFNKVGINVEFTRHFIDRVNDMRNRKPINSAELIRLFKQEYMKWSKPIARLGPDAEAVMKDMQTDINMPFVLNWDRRTQQLDLVAKTVMRKSDFKTPDPVFAVESAQGIDSGTTEEFDGIQIYFEDQGDKIFVQALAGGKELGSVAFVKDILLPQDLEVAERFQGQGIASTMYDYVKSKGYKIRRSSEQTDAGAGFWDKHKPGKKFWEAVDETIIFPIPRNKMPQVDMDHVEDDFKTRRGTVSFSKLRPVQTDRVPGLVNKTIDMILQNRVDKPIMVDKNGYIVNGHHRYDAYKKLGAKPDFQVPVVMIFATLEEIINKYPHTTSDELVVTNETTDTTFAGKDPMSFKSPNGGTPTMLLVTAQGSRYLIASDGMVLRNKSFHANTGGDDQGLKDWSSAIEFYDPSEKPGGVPFALSVAKAVEKKLPVALTDTKNGKRALLIYDGSQWRIAKISDIYKHVASIDAPIVATYSKSPKLNWNVLDYDVDSSRRIVKAHPGSPVTHGISLSKKEVTENTSGSIATVVAPLGGTVRRPNPSIYNYIVSAEKSRKKKK